MRVESLICVSFAKDCHETMTVGRVKSSVLACEQLTASHKRNWTTLWKEKLLENHRTLVD